MRDRGHARLLPVYPRSRREAAGRKTVRTEVTNSLCDRKYAKSNGKCGQAIRLLSASAKAPGTDRGWAFHRRGGVAAPRKSTTALLGAESAGNGIKMVGVRAQVYRAA
jgi:hypothetical protein